MGAEILGARAAGAHRVPDQSSDPAIQGKSAAPLKYHRQRERNGEDMVLKPLATGREGAKPIQEEAVREVGAGGTEHQAHDPQ
jgi:hypothetical protein